jgi:hypothetical protein
MTLRRRCLRRFARLRLVRSALIVSGVAALGCGSEDGGSHTDGPLPPGGQTGEETVGCRPVERDALAWDEPSALGFSADGLLDMLGSESTERLTWSDGSRTSLSVGLRRAASGSAEFQKREYVSNSSGAEPAAEIAAECNDVVAVPVVLSFATADGAFAEQWPLMLLAESTSRVSAYVQADVEALAGSFSVTQNDASRYDRVLVVLQLTFADGTWTGALSGQGITSGSSDPDSTSSASHFAIATF